MIYLAREQLMNTTRHVIVLARSVSVCVSRFPRLTYRHTDLNFDMKVKWKDI